MENDFVKKIKKVVKKNFNDSFEIYSQFENKYKFFHNLTLNLSNFVKITKDSKVLDAGCGCGYSMKAIYDNFSKNVYGIDISEGMIVAGQKLFPNFNFKIGDVAELEKVYEKNFFDFVLFNLVVFIIPDINQVFSGTHKVLKNGGKIAFSYYPEIIDENGNDLFKIAFQRSEFEPPKKQVISRYEDCLNALKNSNFINIKESCYEMLLDISFIKDFFSIPAQSTSLFPKLPYEVRKKNVEKLFDSIKDFNNKGKIIWKFALGEKA